jgi:hypothetical protein
MKKKCNRSTPRMGVQIRDKMYRGPRPSVPAMGKAGGKGITLPGFAAIGAAGQKLYNQDRANVKYASDRMERPGMRRTGKGSYAFINEEEKQKYTQKAKQDLVGLNSIFNADRNASPLERASNVSIPVMGPLGAVAGGMAGKKLGSWVGSAGKLIGPKHEKYGRQAGEYIYGTLGAGLGAMFSPI